MSALPGLVLRKLLRASYSRPFRGYPFHAFEPFAEVDPFSPDSIPQPGATWNGSRRLRLRWYMPEPGKGSGGHRTLFRLIDLLGRRGHASQACILHGAQTGKTRSEMRRFVAEEFGAMVDVVWDTDDVKDCDIVVASSWQTAYTAARDVRCAARAYVVQDWEPDFYARGSEQILAENSYHLGHYHITAGPWLAERLHGLGLPAASFQLGASPDEYFPGGGRPDSSRPHVVFYARPATARRCFEIGCEALRLLDGQLGQGRLLVSMVGSELRPFGTSYEARWLGIVSPDQLRRLYTTAHAVLVLSATNPSLIPLEAALCEVPVVDLDLPSAHGTFVDGVTGLLAPPSPKGIARTLLSVLENPDWAAAIARRAREHALRLTWDGAADEVEQHLVQALESTVALPLGATTQTASEDQR